MNFVSQSVSYSHYIKFTIDCYQVYKITINNLLVLFSIYALSFRFRYTGEQLYSEMRKLGISSMLKDLPGHHRPDTNMPEPLDVDYCPYPLHFDCENFLTKRSIEGSCNNLKHPLNGRSMTPFRRLVPHKYLDGKCTLFLL